MSACVQNVKPIKWSLNPFAVAVLALICILGSIDMVMAMTVTAVNGLSCAGDRAGNLNCNAGEFTTVVNISNSGVPTSCVAGESFTLIGSVSLSGTNADRYNIGFFAGENGNSPQFATSEKCSVATFPTSPSPWFAKNSDVCGDYKSGGVSTPTIENMKVLCAGDASGQLTVPYTLVYSQTAYQCTGPGDVTSGSTSKCNAGTAVVGGVLVFPSVTISDGLDTIHPGDTTTYTVVITNNTGRALSGVVFTDPVVPDLAFDSVSCTSVGATCPSSPTVSAMQGAGIMIPDIPIGGSVTFTIDATLASTAIAPGVLTNTVKVSIGTNNNSVFDKTDIVAPAVNHYELSLPSSGIACLSTIATVTACVDSSNPCTNKSTVVSGKTATLMTSAGTLGSSTVTFNAAGVASTTLSYPAAADGTPVVVTLSGEQVAGVNLRKCCPDGASCVVANSCSTTFNTVGFVFSSAANSVTVPPIPTPQVAGTSGGTYYLRAVKTLDNSSHTCGAAFSGAQLVDFAYECNNPTACYSGDLLSVNAGTATTIARNDLGGLLGFYSYTPVNMTFDASGNAPFTFIYSDVGQIKLMAKKALTADNTQTPPIAAATLTGTSNAFVVKPAGFVLSNIQQTAAPNLANPGAADATGAKFVKAGEAFSATVTAVTSTGSTVYSYGKESSPEGVKLTHALVAPVLGNNPALINSNAFGSFINGVATGTTFQWDEVGIITLTPSVGDADYLGVGDVIGTTTGNVGRFYPDHFGLTGTVQTRSDLLPATGSVFTYMDEPMRTTLTLTPYGKNSETTALVNYKGSFAKLDATTLGTASNWFNTGCAASTQCMGLGAVDGTTGLSGRLAIYTGITNPTSSWSAGVGTFTTDFKLSRGAAPDGAFKTLKIGAVPWDSDGVTLPGTASTDTAHKVDLDATAGNTLASNPDGTNERKLLFTTDVRFGRLKLSNAFGSEKSDLQIPVQAQYWSGKSWVLNNDDNLTSLPSNAFALSGSLAASTSASAVIISGGKGILTLTKPTGSPTPTGSVDVCVDLGPDPASGVVCSATSAAMPWLQGKWPPGANYDNDPSARATFGIYAPETKKTIHVRELY